MYIELHYYSKYRGTRLHSEQAAATVHNQLILLIKDQPCKYDGLVLVLTILRH